MLRVEQRVEQSRSFLFVSVLVVALQRGELLLGRHLLREERGLDALDEALEPADELGLDDPELGLGGDVIVAEGQRDAVELLSEIG